MFNIIIIFYNNNIIFNKSIINIIEILIIMLIVLSISSLLTVLERKGLASSQRRIGPNYYGWYGLIQILLDGIKLIFKFYHFNFINFNIIICCILNFIFSYLLIIFIFIDFFLYFYIFYIFLIIIIILIFNHISIIICGLIINKSKWIILSSIRLIFLYIIYDFIFIIILLCINNNMNFNNIIDFQVFFINFIKLPFFSFFYIFIILIEGGRIPIDLIESESELISGYTIEFPGFLYALFASSEYAIILFHSFFFQFIFFFYSVFNFYFYILFIISIFISFIIIRSTLPRFKFFDLFHFTFFYLLPFSLLFFIFYL
jgi:NADH:ubiquinone oxidoreductase subunit H